MLYVVYLSFHEHAGEEGQGNFSCLVEAENVDAAVAKTADLIENLHEKSDAFDQITAIFLDEIIQVNSFPSTGFLAHWQWVAGTPEGIMSTVLPQVEDKHCEAFTPHPAEDDGEAPQDPFVTFG